MYKIKNEVIESIIIAARNVYPDEFFSMLGGTEDKITELVIVPATFGENFSSYRLDLVPFDKNIIGTIHSHPSPNNNPSRADLESFAAKGKIHLIISHPYTLDTIRAYDTEGNRKQLKVI
ncbi:MAG: Mov34/MPN/PAD-1 family protein [archaeon]|nr:Mov34/MPN/PAD-1 family protein [archaeon]